MEFDENLLHIKVEEDDPSMMVMDTTSSGSVENQHSCVQVGGERDVIFKPGQVGIRNT
ncbi:MAG: hypothetical protein GTO18_17560 [Anaerolineales bacterium]|nr:hypothetical protein [Anaerolineales bacterium]